MFPGNGKKLEDYFPPKNRVLASCPEDRSHLLTLRADAMMHLPQGERNRQILLLWGEIQPTQRSMIGHVPIMKGRLEYICFYALFTIIYKLGDFL